jgi:hypothetical protein
MWPTAVEKRCEKCGITKKVMPRERRCKQMETNALGKSGYWCYGKLVKVVAPKPKKAAKRTTRKKTLQDELAHAHRKLAESITRVKRAVTSVDSWQTEIKRLGKRIEQQHAAEQTPAGHIRTRAIVLPEDE